MYNNQDSNSSNIKFTPSRDNNYSSNTEVGTRPTGDPRSGKDFKKVMEKNPGKGQGQKKGLLGITDDEDEEEGLLTSNDPTTQKSPVSLFDLASNKSGSDEDENQTPTDTPSSLYSKLSAQKISEIASSTDGKESPSQAVLKEKFTTRFDTEQLDLSNVNPMATVIPPQFDSNPINFQTARAPLPTTSMQDLITQMVDQISKMESQGQTDTTITLKYPPIFDGVSLTVSSFDSAKGELNISFENLTQQAKNVLDMRLNQDSLKLALEQKGYAVHIITTNTNIENPVVATDESRQKQRDDQDQKEDQGKGKQRDQEEA